VIDSALAPHTMSQIYMSQLSRYQVLLKHIYTFT